MIFRTSSGLLIM